MSVLAHFSLLVKKLTSSDLKMTLSGDAGSLQMRGALRATAIAAHQARHYRQSKSQELTYPAEDQRHATPTSAPVSVRRQSRIIPLREKRNLKLKLSLGPIRESESPTSSPVPVSNSTSSSLSLNDPLMRNSEQIMQTEAKPIRKSIKDGRRRNSSITVPMNSPEGAEFKEVAHDGPTELGARTKQLKRLGKGAGGTVYLSLYLPTLKLVAVKEVIVFKDQERQMVKNELHALHDNLSPIDREALSDVENVAPPFIVSFHGAYLTPARSAISIVMELMDMGSLQDLLDANIVIPEDVLRHCAFCCYTALDHMHSRRMVHRDIKPANILLNKQGDFKIADFGLAGTLSKSVSFFSEFEGTVMYMAPERISGESYSCVSDSWSMGVVLFSLATGAYPFAVDDGFFGLEEAIVNDPLPPMPIRFSPECRDFIKSLLRRDPETRMTSDKAIAHPFLHGYDGSSARKTFMERWRELPIKSCVGYEDVRRIAQLIVDYSSQYPEMVSVPNVGTMSPINVATDSKESFKRGIFNHLAQLFSPRRGYANQSVASIGDSVSSTKSAIHRLAKDCGVSTEHFQALFEQAKDQV